MRIAHRDAAHLGLATECFAEHVAQIDHADLRIRHAGNLEGRRAHVAGFDLDFLVVQFARTQALAERVARGRACRGAHQRIEHTFFGAGFGLGLHILALSLAHL